MPERWYPLARLKLDGKIGGTYKGTPWRVVLHTTETRGMPSYSSGRYAPHVTYDPRNRTWTQHTSFLYAARALRNVTDSNNTQTNRNNALQVEMICRSAGRRDGYIWVGDLTPEQLGDIAAFIDWTVAEFGVEKMWPGKQAFNSAEANRSGFRMNDFQWDAFGGVCGHQHVPENTHWDPGALVDRVFSFWVFSFRVLSLFGFGFGLPLCCFSLLII